MKDPRKLSVGSIVKMLQNAVGADFALPDKEIRALWLKSDEKGKIAIKDLIELIGEDNAAVPFSKKPGIASILISQFYAAELLQFGLWLCQELKEHPSFCGHDDAIFFDGLRTDPLVQVCLRVVMLRVNEGAHDRIYKKVLELYDVRSDSEN